MTQRIHTEGEAGKVVIYTTKDDVVTQYEDATKTGITFIDQAGLEFFIPKERVLRIITFDNDNEN